MTPEEFIHTIGPAAVASAVKTKVPASFTIAEGALESGWGSSLLAQRGCNLFGVKADKSWKGEILTMNTREYQHGRWIIVPAKWRKYPDWLACIDDHAAFLTQNPRYLTALKCTDGESFARATAAAGYATDPAYAEKLIAVMRSHNLAQFDKS